MTFLPQFILFEVLLEAPRTRHVMNLKVHIYKCQLAFYYELHMK